MKKSPTNYRRRQKLSLCGCEAEAFAGARARAEAESRWPRRQKPSSMYQAASAGHAAGEAAQGRGDQWSHRLANKITGQQQWDHGQPKSDWEDTGHILSACQRVW